MFEAFGASFGATLAGCLVLIGTTSAAVYFFMKRRKTDLEPQQNNNSEQMTFLQMQRLIYAEIRDICEIALVKENFSSDIPIDEDKKIPLLNVHMPGSSRKLLLSYSGTIVCGFELKDVKTFPEADRRLKIFLPQSKILHSYADMKSIKVYNKETGIFAKDITLEEQNRLIDADLENRKQKSIQEGLLLRANENARQLLWSRIENRGLTRNFDIQIATSSNVPALNAP